MTTSRRIAVVGAGAWGTALAIRWAAHHEVTLVARRAEHAEALRTTRENAQYLPKFFLPKALDIAPQVPLDSQVIVLGVPTTGLIDALAMLRAAALTQVPIVSLCKGFVGDAAALPLEVIRARGFSTCAALSGPSFAQEVATGLPAAVALASHDAAFANDMAHRLRDDALRIYPTTDMTGVEIGGAVKNVLAIAAGLCDGLQLGHNARAALITRGLAEVTRLAVAMGGRPETLAGLAGMGDLVLTCTGDLSRNRRVGLGLAAGKSLDEVVRELGHVAEGVPAAQKTMLLAEKFSVEMPIVEAVAALLHGETTPTAAVQALMSRAMRSVS